jgi:hypothetical protein
MRASLLNSKITSRLTLLAGVATASFLLLGCTQARQPGYYNPPPASTTQDAIQFAEGGVTQRTVSAPSQVQIKLNPGTPKQPASTVVAQSGTDSLTPQGQAELQQETQQDFAPQGGLIPQPETFFGTLPCFHKDMRCSAQQITLTLAPNGRWRARVSYLENGQASGQAQTDQGCWNSLAMRPPRILIMDGSKNVRAELTMTSPEVLRLRSLDGQTPNLTYTLNRQPDLDPISELDKATVPNCN